MLRGNKVSDMEQKGPTDDKQIELKNAKASEIAKAEASDYYYFDKEAFIKEVKAEVVGKPVEGWRRPFFLADPFLAEQYVRDTRPFNDFNIFFNVLFRLAVLAFWIYFSIEYSKAKSSTSYSIAPADTLLPIQVTLSLGCNTKWGCYNWTGPATTTEFITVSGVYNNVNKANCPISNFNETISSAYAKENVTFTVCFSNSFYDGVFLNVPFSSSYASGAILDVLITAPTYTNSMQFDMQVTPSQLKIVYLSQIQTMTLGSTSPPTYNPYVADQFYNGHTANNVAQLSFKLQQFGYTSTSIPAPTYLTTLGIIGGFTHFMYPVMSLAKSFTGVLSKCAIFWTIPMGQWYGVFFNMSRAAMMQLFKPPG